MEYTWLTRIRAAYNPQRYATFITAVFLLAGALSASYHEMWRDEIQAWLIARDSSSFVDLFYNLKYEGHPGLWHVFLLPLSRITPSPVIMQGFHLLIAAATVYLFVRYSPFSRLQKFLFSFGYFPFYEYSIICRNYGIGLLLICLFCVLFQRRYSKFLLVSAVLFLLGHTSAHALIIVAATGFALLLDYLFLRKRLLASGEVKEWQVWAGFVLIAIGIVTSVIQTKPPDDTGFAVGWFMKYDLVRLKNVIEIMTRAFFPIPEAKLHFWGSQWLTKYPTYTKIQLSLSVGLIVWSSLILLRKPTAMLTYILGTFGLLSFFYVKYFGSMRHHGLLFVLFIMTMWICRCDEGFRWPGPVRGFTSLMEKSLNPLLILILSAHLAGGIIATRMDFRYVFSQAKATAEFIKSHHLKQVLMVGEKDYAVSTIVGYLKKDQIYYPAGDRFGSYIIWDLSRTKEVSNDQVIQKAEDLKAKHKEDVLIILNRQLSANQVLGHSRSELAKFTGAAVGDEDFYLYLLR